MIFLFNQKLPFIFRHLFNAAFLSCWTELDEGQQDELVECIQLALKAPDVPPEVTHTLLNLAEFMEHTDKASDKILREVLTQSKVFQLK